LQPAFPTCISTIFTSPDKLQIPRLRFRSIAFVDNVEVRSHGQLVADGVYAFFTESLEDDAVIVIAVSFVYQYAGAVIDLHIVVRELGDAINTEVVILRIAV